MQLWAFPTWMKTIRDPSLWRTNQRPRTAKKSVNAFRTISEVATEMDLPQHVLRFWESKFSQIKPMKRGGGGAITDRRISRYWAEFERFFMKMDTPLRSPKTIQEGWDNNYVRPIPSTARHWRRVITNR